MVRAGQLLAVLEQDLEASLLVGVASEKESAKVSVVTRAGDLWLSLRVIVRRCLLLSCHSAPVDILADTMRKKFLEGGNITTLNITEHILVVSVRRCSGLLSKSLVIALSSKHFLTIKIVIISVKALLIILTFRVRAFVDVY